MNTTVASLYSCHLDHWVFNLHFPESCTKLMYVSRRQGTASRVALAEVGIVLGSNPSKQPPDHEGFIPASDKLPAPAFPSRGQVAYVCKHA